VATNRRINITPAERTARVLAGTAAAVAGGWLLAAGEVGWLAGTGAVLLVLAGLDLVVTGAVGYCPLYARLGYVPPRLRTPAPSPVRAGHGRGRR
jgi:hypothetical protein